MPNNVLKATDNRWSVSNVKCPYCGRNLYEQFQTGMRVNPHSTGSHDKYLPDPAKGRTVYSCNNQQCGIYDVTRDASWFEKARHDHRLMDDYCDMNHKPHLKSMQMPLIKIDSKRVASNDKCPVCGSTLYKFDDKSLKQEGNDAFRECQNPKCKLYNVILPLGRMADISDKEIANFRNRNDRQDALAEGKTPFESYDATTSLKYDTPQDQKRNYRYSNVKKVVSRNFIKD